MSRKKKVEIEKDFEDLVEEQWDLKKILIGAITLLVISGGIFFAYSYLGGKGFKSAVLGTQDIKPVENIDTKQEQEKIIAQSKEDAQKIIDRLQEEIDKLKSENLTSSSGQIQKMISDLQELQGKQKDPKDIFCEYVCKDNK